MSDDYEENAKRFYDACREMATQPQFVTQVAGLPGATLLALVTMVYHQSDSLLLCARRLSQITPVPDVEGEEDGHRLVASLARSLTTAFELNTNMQLLLTAFAEEYPTAPYPEQA